PTRTSCGREDIWRWRRKLHDAAFTGPRGGRGLGGAGGDPSEAWQEVMTGEAGEVLESRSGSSPVDRRLRRLQKMRPFGLFLRDQRGSARPVLAAAPSRGRKFVNWSDGPMLLATAAPVTKATDRSLL